MHIPSLDVPAGVALNTVVSDNDDYEGVLPIGAVKTVYIRETASPPAVAQNRPTGGAEIIAAIDAKWQRDASALPPGIPPAVAIAAAGPPATAATGPPVAAGVGGVPSAAPGPGPGAVTVQRAAAVQPGAGGAAPAPGGSAVAQPSGAGDQQNKAVTAASTIGGRNPFGGEKGGQAEAVQVPAAAQQPASPPATPGTSATDYMDGASAAVISMPSTAFNSNGR